MHTDPIADLLTRIRNASRAHHNAVTISYSKIKESILKIMQDKGFISNVEVKKNGKFQELSAILNDDRTDLTLKRISKPGQRIYIKKEDIRPLKSGLGIAIISTSKGLMSDQEAKKQSLGGELICEIY